MFEASLRWKEAYPRAMVAMLVVRNVENVREHPALEERKRALEAELRKQFTDADEVKADEAIRAYTAYYKRFEKTYHVAGQLKSLIVRQRPLPVVSGLVDVMFIAEMKNRLLTAGHDLASVEPPVVLDAAAGDETYVKMNREEQAAKASDMVTSDRVGILSSVVHGPDYRTRITPGTRNALYVTYAPDGIRREQLLGHLRDIVDGVALFSPSVSVEPALVLSARGVEEVSV